MAECARAAGSPLPGVVVPCGVDVDRFVPLDAAARRSAREHCGIDPDRPVVLGVSRLVPRKGFDVLIEAMATLGRDAQLVIGGSGRDRERLERLAAERGVPVQFLGRVPDADMAALYGCADVFAMLCRADRWGGLEAEGFGIVFLEAAACGVPQIAGRSGGSHEAVADGETGFVVEPRDVAAVRRSLQALLDDDTLRTRMAEASRARAVASFSYEVLVPRLAPVAAGDFSGFEEHRA
jgi:phosphatidylinositol alpha-1,6-mannosyltransferase